MNEAQKARDARLKAALRDNLKKRKARERDADPDRARDRGGDDLSAPAER